MPAAGAAGGGGSGKVVGITLAVVFGGLIVIGGAVLAAVMLLGGDDFDEQTILLEPVGSEGPNPFGPSAAPPPDEHLNAFAEQGARQPQDAELAASLSNPAEAIQQRNGQAVIDGATPGLYGGTGRAGSCDPDQIAAYLADNPDRARAWADVAGITPDEIPAYLATLTPLNLGADTRVINHGYLDGRATPHHAVLQRGTAVLVDQHGVPRVRCECGNPLLEPAVEVRDVTYTGQQWPNFREQTVIVIERTPQPVRGFEYTGIRPDDPLRGERPTGTRGDNDTILIPTDTTGPDLDDGELCHAAIGDDGRAYQVVLHHTWDTDQVDCARANEIAQMLVNEYLLHGQNPDLIGDDHAYGCESFEQLDAGQPVLCSTDELVFTIFPPDDDEFTDNGLGGPDPGGFGGPQASGEFCGELRDIGMLGDADAEAAFAVFLDEDSAESCEIAMMVAEAFILDLSDYVFRSDQFPYEPTVQGWDCTSGPFLNPADQTGFFGCRTHNATIELVAPMLPS